MESFPDFSVFSERQFQPKGRFDGKSCLFSIAHKTWLKRYMTVTKSSFWRLGTKDYSSQQNFNLTFDPLQEMPSEFQKRHFEEN